LGVDNEALKYLKSKVLFIFKVDGRIELNVMTLSTLVMGLFFKKSGFCCIILRVMAG